LKISARARRCTHEKLKKLEGDRKATNKMGFK